MNQIKTVGGCPQLLLIYQILSVDLNWKIEEHPFKYIAQKFGYTPMTITKAIDNLKSHELIDVFGEKEKFIGHHHCNTPDFFIGNTRLITNQLGYVQYRENELFETGRVIIL